MEFRWLWLVFFTHVGLCSRPSNDRQVSLQSTGDRVQVTLLYEALCPFCQLFFRNQLVPLMRSGLEKYIQLELVPYGNGHVSNHTVQCQHGPSECQLNTAHLCAMRVLKDNKKSFDAIACMETNQQPDKTMVNDWTDCLEASDRTKIVGCMKSQGTALLKAAAMRTDAFSHRYVPWVLLNNAHEESATHNLGSAICGALPEIPSELKATCNEFLQSFVKTGGDITDVCWKN